MAGVMQDDDEDKHASGSPRVERWRRAIAGTRVDLHPPPGLGSALDRRIARLVAPETSLMPEDAIALVILEVRIGLTVQFTEPGKVITRAREIELETVAVGTVALLCMPTLIACGIVPFGASQRDTEAAVNRWWLAWCAAVEKSPDGPGDDHARHAAIRAHVEAIIRPHLAPPAVALASAMEGVRRWHRHHGRRVDAKHVSPEEAASEFSALTLLRPAPLGLFFKNANGKLQISDTELRDRLGRRKRASEPLFKRRRLKDDGGALDGALAAVDAVDAASVVDALRRTALATAMGSADRVVLEHFCELAEGETTARALADRYGLNERTVQVAAKRWRERLRDHRRMRDVASDP